ncbi:MAG: hypothetical protein ACOX6I_00430 [Syntrophomonadaceae bacterium]|jgi:hypothetical protein
MLSSLWDQKNSVIKRVMNDDRIDPGTFSFMEAGWWALHAAAIAGVFYLGQRMSHNPGSRTGGEM